MLHSYYTLTQIDLNVVFQQSSANFTSNFTFYTEDKSRRTASICCTFTAASVLPLMRQVLNLPRVMHQCPHSVFNANEAANQRAITQRSSRRSNGSENKSQMCGQAVGRQPQGLLGVNLTLERVGCRSHGRATCAKQK